MALIQARRDEPQEYRALIYGALKDQAGSIPLAALQLRISTSTLRRWITKDPSLTQDITIAKGGWPKDVSRKLHPTLKNK